MDENKTIKKVLITGAYGLIGNLVYARLSSLSELYDAYGMVRRVQPSSRAAVMNFMEPPLRKLRLADLTDPAAVQRAVDGMDVIVHMAADPDGRSGWESVLNNNIIGAHNIFEAARLEGVKRVVYASTNQVVFGYREAGGAMPENHPQINESQPTRPLNYYSCSKVFGEGLAHMYSRVHGLSCICLRIGWVTSDDKVPHARAQAIWCSQRDIVQLVEKSINAPDDLRFDIFFGHSDNKYNLVDISHARKILGYEPLDKAEEHLQ
jgi:NAD+ dependent glucose-6-phosphate dehydrogenase